MFKKEKRKKRHLFELLTCPSSYFPKALLIIFLDEFPYESRVQFILKFIGLLTGLCEARLEEL